MYSAPHTNVPGPVVLGIVAPDKLREHRPSFFSFL